MAKSKKALKALKRRKAAKGRSRALKERQDYTGGGRVKAFTGFPGNISIPTQEEIKKQVEALGNTEDNVATSNAEDTPPPEDTSPTTDTSTTTDTSEQDAAAREAAELEARRDILRRNGTIGMDTDGDGRLSEAEKYKAATGVDMPPRGEQPPPSEEAAPADTSPPSDEAAPPGGAATPAPSAETTAPAATAAQETTAAPVTGTVPPNQVNLDSSPFDYSGLTIDPDGQVLNVRVNDGSGNRVVQIPFGSLSAAQQQDLRNIASNNPDLDKRAVIAYDYFNRTFGLKSTAEEEVEEESPAEEAPPTEEAPPSEETTEEEGVTIPAVFNGDYADFNPAPVRPEGGGIGRINRYNTERREWNNNKERWDSLTPLQRSQQFGAGQGTLGTGTIVVNQQTGEISSTGTSSGQVSPQAFEATDPAEVVLDRIYDEEQRKNFRVDGPEAFQTQQTSLEGTVLGGRQLSEIQDIGERTVTADDIVTRAGTFKGATAQDQISAQSMQAYNQAEANYFDKYPEARQAIQDGTYKNVFDYHAKVGIEQGNTLTFDTSKIAKADFNRIAEATSSELQQTQAAQRDAEAEQAALARRPVFTQDVRSQIDPVTGETITLSATANAEKQQRQAITDEEAAQGTEAIIQGSVGYEAAERREIKGEAAKGSAASMLAEVGGLPSDIAETILDNPAQVTAQVDNQPVEVQAAIAALPQEALVSVQLENLLAGIDEGTTPAWARPAVQLVESRLNARGLSVSTVGRDALFNAIIQTALPIAQSNATALQQRANQNLSNEQQANLQQASQEMQLRLTNVANRQTSESQSAQLAQQINLTQGEMKQQVALTESQQAQQVRLQSLQNEQQAEMANLGNDQQIELANLQVEAQRLGANQSAVNQERLAEMQVAASFLTKNQEFKQQMEIANLSSDQQMRLAFLTAKNQAEAQNLTAAQQTELANLNKNLEVNKITAGLAQQMGLAQLNVDQQTAIRNAATVANMDLAKFSAEQQIELSNSKFMQTSTLQDLNNNQQAIIRDATSLAAMDMQEADLTSRASIENARNFLQKDLANLSTEQQSYLLDAQQRQQRLLTSSAAENAASQFNATSQAQTDQFMAGLGQQLNLQNAAQENAMEQFNATEANRIAAVQAGNDLEAARFSAQLNSQIDQFNTQVDFQRDQWNQQNAQAVEQSNVNWRRQVNMAETAATNAANQMQAQQLFQLSQQEQSFLWQQLRDEANYYRQQYENEQQRKTTLYATALANEAEDSSRNIRNTFGMIGGLFTTAAAAMTGTGQQTPTG